MWAFPDGSRHLSSSPIQTHIPHTNTKQHHTHTHSHSHTNETLPPTVASQHLYSQRNRDIEIYRNIDCIEKGFCKGTFVRKIPFKRTCLRKAIGRGDPIIYYIGIRVSKPLLHWCPIISLWIVSCLCN